MPAAENSVRKRGGPFRKALFSSSLLRAFSLAFDRFPAMPDTGRGLSVDLKKQRACPLHMP